MTAETVEAMGIPSNNGDDEEVDSPVFRSCVFRLVKKETWLTPDHWERFDELTLEVAKDLFGETDAESANEVFGEDQYALLEEEYFYSENSQLLGHPFFTQEDVREEGSRYNTLLFQLDSETVDDVVMWGRLGRGQLLHQRRRLEEFRLQQRIVQLGLLLRRGSRNGNVYTTI